MNRSLLIVGAIAIALIAGSCASSHSPVAGYIYKDVKAPLAVTASTGTSKVGQATAKSILGWIGSGHASIEAACKEAGITRIHHVDYQTKSILSFYATYTVLVYGE